jgi:hypothetical protein
VLFVVDNTQSMASSQNNLGANFPSFIKKFISNGYDFKIAVTTSEAFLGGEIGSGGFLGTSNCSECVIEKTYFRSGLDPKIYVIESKNYNLFSSAEQSRLVSDFTANVLVGTNGSNDERAFSSFQATLNSVSGASPNIGFHRPGAYLAVIIVSDGDDFSTNKMAKTSSYTSSELFPLTYYRDYLQSFTSGMLKEDFSVSTISILDDVCRNTLSKSHQSGTQNGGQQVGTRYMGLADLTGGAKISLCDSFDTALDGLTGKIISAAKPVYTLDKKPILNSIQVLVDGITVPQSTTDGWSYDAAANTISINGTTYKPNVGSSVVINFDPDLA